jgi:FG-GAP-like repeat
VRSEFQGFPGYGTLVGRFYRSSSSGTEIPPRPALAWDNQGVYGTHVPEYLTHVSLSNCFVDLQDEFKMSSKHRLVTGTILLVLTTVFSHSKSTLPPNSDVTDLPFEHVILDNKFQDEGPFHGDCKGMADINGDGLLDVVFAGNTLVWYAYPGWTKTVIAKATQEFTTDMQLGDVDGDGDPDVIVPDGEKGKLCWFENPRPRGDPAKDSWKCHLIGYQGDWGHDVEVGDIDGDGRLDVLTRKTSTLVWFQKDPDSFTQLSVDTALLNGEGTALADINRDGYLDLVQNGYWLECPRDPIHGYWVKHRIDEGWPRQLGVTVADINSDGRLDVLLAPAESRGRLSWYEGPRDPRDGLWFEHVIDDNVEFVHTFKVADMNNDGQPDVVTAEMHQSKQRRVSLYLKEGYSLNWRKQVIATTGSHNLRVGDIGNDGDVDIVGANWGGNYHPVELWQNQLIDRNKLSVEKEWAYVQVDNHRAKWGDFNDPVYLRYLGLVMGDVTADGYKDVVSGRYFYRNPGRDSKASWSRADLGMNVDGMLLLDVDGDGRLDLIAEALPNVYWLKPMAAEGNAWTAALIGTVPRTEHINSQGYGLAQIVAGGKPEVVLAGGDGIYYFEIPEKPEAGNWPRVKVGSDTSEEGIGIGDIDGDGDADLAAADKNGHNLFWWENPGNGKGDWVDHPVGSTAEWADRCVVADINGDKRLDIVVSEEIRYHGASVYWFEQPKDLSRSNWTRHTVVTQFTTNAMDVADMDQDGDMDIITGEHRGTRKLSIWENVNHGTSWVEHVVDTGKENHLGARVTDLDGDGRLEILGIAWDTYPYLHLWRRK